MKPTKWVGAAVAAAALTACTPTQLAQWQEWYASDPEAAVTYANQPDIQAQLHNAATNERQPSSSVWDRLAWCESGGNWAINTGNGYSGGLQFLHSAWRAYGGREFASIAAGASRSQQIIVAERILDDVGWRAWPACSRKLGLR
jgi:hypothetical protein